jgi:hypothetical protein
VGATPATVTPRAVRKVTTAKTNGDAIAAFVEAFEGRATDVLTAGDVTAAVRDLNLLKTDFAKFTEQYQRAESALEMAHLQVMSRL